MPVLWLDRLSIQLRFHEHNTTSRTGKSFPFILRVLWFFLVGWYITLWFWILIAWFLNLTIIGLPLRAVDAESCAACVDLAHYKRLQCCRPRSGDKVAWRYEHVQQPPLGLRIAVLCAGRLVVQPALVRAGMALVS